MKNSSRLLAEIERNRMRSSSGWASFPASSSTRMLNCSQLTSRLTNRAGLSRNASTSGVAPSVSAISVISFIIGLQIELFDVLAAGSAPQRQRFGRNRAGDRAAAFERQPIHQLGKGDHFCRRSLHARHHIPDNARIDHYLPVAKQLYEHLRQLTVS